MKRFLSIFMTVVIVFSFAACSKNGAQSKTENKTVVWYFNDEDTDVKELFNNVDDTINPEEIFSSLKIEENMLYGVYTINNQEKDIEKLSKELTFKDTEFHNGTFSISSIPIGVYSGTNYLMYSNEYRFNAVTD